ncbi:MAG: hypothetical protein RR239_03170 [Oscillospiraceae bacterium]
MIIFSVFSSALMIAAIVLFLKLTPEQITNDIMKIIAPKQTLRDKVKIAQKRKKSHKIQAELSHIKDALTSTGNGNKFAVVCALSLTFLIIGAVLAVLIDNLFLMPIISVALALIPFVYAKNIINHYDKHIKLEMETALSIVSTSYIRSDDIIGSVAENISYLKPPVREIFKSFLGEATAIRSDIKGALEHLKDKVDNDIWGEWVDTLVACQDDRTMKSTLLSVVNKLTDVRIVNNELKTMLYEPRKEYWMMVAMVVGNIPLLYMLNHDWYATLMFSVPGKIVLAVCGIVILITAFFMFKYTKPIEYKR